jgi:hypothetical protein
VLPMSPRSRKKRERTKKRGSDAEGFYLKEVLETAYAMNGRSGRGQLAIQNGNGISV